MPQARAARDSSGGLVFISQNGGTIMRHRTFGLGVCAGALLVLLSAVSGEAHAQSAVITGKVTGRGSEPLGGATVLIEGLGISAGTAQSGTYTLTVPADKAKGQTVTLRARYIGYQAGTKQITLTRSEEHTSELQSLAYLVCRLLLEKKKKKTRKVLSLTRQ